MGAAGLKQRVLAVGLIAIAITILTLRSVEEHSSSDTALHVFSPEADATALLTTPLLAPDEKRQDLSSQETVLEDVRSSLRGFLEGVEKHLSIDSIEKHQRVIKELTDHKPFSERASLVPSDTEWCIVTASQHNIVPGSSWGTTTAAIQQEWTSRNCDRKLQDHGSESKPIQLPPQVPQGAEPKEQTFLEGGKNVVLDSKHSPVKFSGVDPESAWCRKVLWKHNVRPGSSWGSLSEKDKANWRKRSCDSKITSTASFIEEESLPRCSVDDAQNGGKKRVAVCCGTTTRNVKGPQLAKLALFRYLLPSMARTVDCGLDYMIVVGFDKGDPFYDTLHGKLQVEQWFTEFVEEPLATRSITVKLHLVQVDNKLKKPGPVFNKITKHAYDNGADYIYRVNDDTEMVGPWANHFIREIHKLGEPYGAVGPLCQQGNRKILTHDFTHRTHMEIFDGLYYPAELVDWWMDDWISRVYGSRRTRQGVSVKVVHHTQAHGQRYKVDKSNKQHLERLLRNGKDKIMAYMKAKSLDNKAISDVASDRFDGFPFIKNRQDPEDSVMLQLQMGEISWYGA